MAVTAAPDEVHRVISAAVDPAFYRAVYPELDTADLDPVRHYAAHGWREGRDPAPWFSTTAYLATNADVRRSGVEPFYHYLLVGRREGREVLPSPQGERYLLSRAVRGEPVAWRYDPGPSRPPAPPRAIAAPAPPETLQAVAHERALVATEFDIAFYLEANPDVAAAGADALEHFLVAGWREGRDPNPRFSVTDYLETYPDIASAGVNPFHHYLLAGRTEGRQPRAKVGFRYQTLAALAPVADRVAALKAVRPVKLGTEDALVAGLGASRTGLKDLHVTFSHDDYTSNLGGVQLCLQREDARIAELGRDHLHLYPVKPWPVVRVGGEAGQLGIVWNGEGLGAYAPKTIAAALRRAVGGVKPGQRSFAIHSLLGHTADETADILAAAGLTAGYFWLHDFASLCAGFHLLRNDVQDCAAPPPDSAACAICAYLPMRRRHLDQHARLFDRLDLTVVSPSEPTLALWRERWSYPAKGEVVLPHARLVARGPAPVSRKARPLRLAYVGFPAAHKGWPIFRELALRHAADPRYQFLHLGMSKVAGLPAEFHEVVVTEAHPRRMQERLETLEVDAVLIWPLCRETFSFTAYEAAAAGCAVITGPDSGNVQAFVRETGLGRVLPDEAALAAAVESGALAELSRGRRKPMLYDLAFSAMTVDLLTARP